MTQQMPDPFHELLLESQGRFSPLLIQHKLYGLEPHRCLPECEACRALEARARRLIVRDFQTFCGYSTNTSDTFYHVALLFTFMYIRRRPRVHSETPREWMKRFDTTHLADQMEWLLTRIEGRDVTPRSGKE